MLLILIALVIFVGGFILSHYSDYCIEGICGVCGIIGIIFGGMALIIMGLIILIANTAGNTETTVKMQEKRDAIYFTMRDNDKDVRVRNQLYNDIAEYNSLVRVNQHYRDSLWTNWFVEPVYDELETIEYDED